MTELMNTSTRSQHFPPNPNEIAGNRRPARPSSAQQRSTTPTRNRPPTNNATNGLNTTAKLEQSLLKYEGERSFSSTTGKHSSAEKSSNKGKDRLYSTWTPLKHDTTNSQVKYSAFIREKCRSWSVRNTVEFSLLDFEIVRG